jgi:microcystin-dependent protein
VWSNFGGDSAPAVGGAEVAEIRFFGLRLINFGGWRLCDGDTLSLSDDTKVKNAGLYSAWDDAYGHRTDLNGVTVLKCPNLKGKVIASTSPTHKMGSVEGSETQTLTVANLPPHKHDVSTTASGKNHTHAFTTGSNNRTHTHNSGTYKTATATTSSAYATSYNLRYVPAAGTPYETDNGHNVEGSGGEYPKQDSGGTNTTDTNHHHTMPSVDVAGNSGIESRDHTHDGSTNEGNTHHTHPINESIMGSNTPHNNMQPTGFMGNYFIWVGI